MLKRYLTRGSVIEKFIAYCEHVLPERIQPHAGPQPKQNDAENQQADSSLYDSGQRVDFHFYSSSFLVNPLDVKWLEVRLGSICTSRAATLLVKRSLVSRCFRLSHKYNPIDNPDTVMVTTNSTLAFAMRLSQKLS